MATGSIDVRVENQLVRFVCPMPLDHDRVVAEVGGQRNSGVVIKAMERPRATLVIDEEGRIVVHGTHRVEAARAAAKELLLRMGMDDSGLVAEMGPVVVSFQFEQSINLEAIPAALPSGSAEYDARLGCRCFLARLLLGSRLALGSRRNSRLCSVPPPLAAAIAYEQAKAKIVRVREEQAASDDDIGLGSKG